MSGRTLLVLPLAALSFASCIFVVSGDGLDWDSAFDSTHWGSGVRGEATRDTPAFQEIELETSANVTVRVGEAQSITLSGDNDLLTRVQTNVRNGTLQIDMPDGYGFRSGLEVAIGVPSLDRFSIEGSGDVRIEGLAADSIELSIEGAGTITARGSARRLDASIEGSGELALNELAVEDAEVSIEGSGEIRVDVTRTLSYSIEGSGDIEYRGEPTLHGSIEGSGNIERAD